MSHIPRFKFLLPVPCQSVYECRSWKALWHDQRYIRPHFATNNVAEISYQFLTCFFHEHGRDFYEL